MQDKLVKITFEYEDRIASIEGNAAAQWLEAHTKACQMLLEKLNVNSFAWLPQDWKVLAKLPPIPDTEPVLQEYRKKFEEWKQDLAFENSMEILRQNGTPGDRDKALDEICLEKAFNAGCRANNGMVGCEKGSFGWMLEQLKEGVTCCRKDWYSLQKRICKVHLKGCEINIDSVLIVLIKDSQGSDTIYIPSWEDIFATDWQVYE